MKTKIILVLGFVAACGTNPQPEAPRAAPPAALSPAHHLLRENSELFRKLLTSTGDDADEALTPGEPVDVFIVRADELSLFPGGEIAPLLHETGQRMFPLHGRAGAAKSGMTLMRTENGWQLARAGAANLTRGVVEARAALPAGAEEVKLVRILALGIDVLSFRQDGDLMVMPLFGNRNEGLAARQPLPASVLFEQLAPKAARVLAEDR